MSPLIVTLLVLFGIWLLIKCYAKIKYLWILKKLPQPLTTKFLFGSALDFLMVPRGKLSETFVRLMLPIFGKHQIICLWIFLIPRVMIVRAKAAEEVLSSNILLTKASFYDLIHPWLGHGLLTSTGQRWKSHRKLLTPSFHFRILENFLPIFNDQSETMIKKLKEERADRGIFNIYPYITLCALDIICETAMGTKINAQSGKNTEYVNAINTLSEILLMRNLKAWLLVPWIFALSHYSRLQKKSLKILHKFTRDVIDERRKEYDSGKLTKNTANDDLVLGQKIKLAFLDTLLQASDNYTKLSLKDIQEEVDTFMFEGHDTTAVAIGWALHHLGWLPSKQEKVHKELDEIFGDSDRAVTLEDLPKLVYLGATIKESLRLTPSVPLYGRKINSDITIAGSKIPAGTDVLINPTMVAADEEIYKNPRTFQPERFLNEEWLHRHPYSFLAFSAGPRNCIGQKFALMEEKVVLANILRRFEVKTHVSMDLTEMVPDVVLRPLKGFRVELLQRKPHAS